MTWYLSTPVLAFAALACAVFFLDPRVALSVPLITVPGAHSHALELSDTRAFSKGTLVRLKRLTGAVSSLQSWATLEPVLSFLKRNVFCFSTRDLDVMKAMIRQF
jgi:hypothetical protein